MPRDLQSALTRFAIALFATALSSMPAWAACLQERGLGCRSDFSSFGAVTWFGGDYVLAGRLKSGEGSGLAVMHVSRDGQPGALMVIPLPEGLADPAPKASVRALVPGPKGVMMLVASIEVRQPFQQTIGWVVAIGPKGVLWNKLISDPQDSVVVHGAHFDTTLNRLFVVGRVTQGRDDGRCSAWSQSYVRAFDGTTGKPLEPQLAQGTTQKDPSNRQALYDVISGDQPNELIVAGFQTGPVQGTSQCRDGMVIGRLEGDAINASDGGKWQVRSWKRLVSDSGDQDAFLVRSVGKGRYIVAGTGAGADLPVYLIDDRASFDRGAITGLAQPAGTPTADRVTLHAAVPLRKTSQVLLGGSLTNGSTTVAFWQIANADLSQAESPVVFKEAGSDLTDAVLSPSGQILAVGRVLDGNKVDEGWFGFIAPGGSSDAPASANFATAFRNNSTPIDSLRTDEGIFQLSGNDIQSKADLSGGTMREHDSKGIAFDIVKPETIGIAAQGIDGDIDIVLSDQTRTMVGFSNQPGLGLEILIRTLQPGHYTLAVLAQSAVSGFRVRIAPTRDIDIADLTAFLRLNEEERIKLSDQLAKAGYGAAPQPSIALGSETARDLLAAQANSARPFGPRGIGKSVAVLLGGP